MTLQGIFSCSERPACVACARARARDCPAAMCGSSCGVMDISIRVTFAPQSHCAHVLWACPAQRKFQHFGTAQLDDPVPATYRAHVSHKWPEVPKTLDSRPGRTCPLVWKRNPAILRGVGALQCREYVGMCIVCPPDRIPIVLPPPCLARLGLMGSC